MVVLLSKYLSRGAIQLFNFWLLRLLTHLNEEPAHWGMASKPSCFSFQSGLFTDGMP